MKLSKRQSLILSLLFLVLAFIIAGKYDHDINNEQSSTFEDYHVGVTIVNDDTLSASQLLPMLQLLDTLNRHQISELIYNTDREVWDTVAVSQLYATYEVNPIYYTNLK